jgi:hypothetical protein
VSLFFLFVQFEFTHAIGPHAGRYVVESGGRRSPPLPAGQLTALEARNREAAGVSRDIGAADVLVVGVVSAPASRPKILRRARLIDPAALPAEVPLSLVTYVRGTEPTADGREAKRALEHLRFSDEEQQSWVAEGLTILNTAIRAHRAGAHDPYALEVTRRDARRIRIGYGSTEDVQAGRWLEAIELAEPPGPKPSRIERLRPAEAVAAALTGESSVLESEDVLLRALIDLDNGRSRAAAFQVGAAMRLLPKELGVTAPELGRLEWHARRAEELEAAAGTSELGDAEISDLEAVIVAVDEALEARRYEQVAEAVEDRGSPGPQGP